MAKEVERKYSEAQEARIRDAAASNGGKINNDVAEMLADEFGKDVRSVRAKATNMGLYQAKAKTSKSGGKLETKEEIRDEIAEILDRNMDSLEKAGKVQLQIIRDFLKAA